MLLQFKPILVLTIIIGVAFGDEVGFLVGAMSVSIIVIIGLLAVLQLKRKNVNKW